MSSTCRGRRAPASEGQQAALRRRVLARAEGEAGIDLDRQEPFRHPVAGVAAMDDEAPGQHRRMLPRRRRHPVGLGHGGDLETSDVPAGRAAGRGQPVDQPRAVRLRLEEQLDGPVRRRIATVAVMFEGGDAERLLVERLECSGCGRGVDDEAHPPQGAGGEDRACAHPEILVPSPGAAEWAGGPRNTSHALLHSLSLGF
ncbi:MAG: hypothetical protein U1E14_01640 [Geminicoccaceae bacterium]